jgi:hypothetical protein
LSFGTTIFILSQKKKWKVNCDSGTKSIGLPVTTDIVALVGCQMVERQVRLEGLSKAMRVYKQSKEVSEK